MNSIDLYQSIISTARPKLGFALLFVLVHRGMLTKQEIADLLFKDDEQKKSFLTNIGKVGTELANLGIIDIRYFLPGGEETTSYVRHVTVKYAISLSAKKAWLL